MYALENKKHITVYFHAFAETSLFIFFSRKGFIRNFDVHIENRREEACLKPKMLV